MCFVTGAVINKEVFLLSDGFSDALPYFTSGINEKQGKKKSQDELNFNLTPSWVKNWFYPLPEIGAVSSTHITPVSI